MHNVGVVQVSNLAYSGNNMPWDTMLTITFLAPSMPTYFIIYTTRNATSNTTGATALASITCISYINGTMHYSGTNN